MQNKYRLIAATGNPDKVREFRELSGDSPVEIVSYKELGVKVDIVENGSSFAENALLKARSVHAATGGTVFADDSGLSVDAMDGAPGIYSARFMGEDADYETKCGEIFRRLRGVPEGKRGAAFCCAIACVFEDGTEEVREAEVRGMIIDEMRGEGGFGYDPIFYVPEFGCTTAEMTEEQKNKISHRGKAFRAALPGILEHLLKNE